MTLVEHDITCRALALYHEGKGAIHLDAISIADEDPCCALVIKLPGVVELLHICQVAEHVEVAHHRLASIPGLI